MASKSSKPSDKQLEFADALRGEIYEAVGDEGIVYLDQFLVPKEVLEGDWEKVGRMHFSDFRVLLDTLLLIKKNLGLEGERVSKTAGEPASDKQKEFIASLAEEAGEEVDTENLTRGEASKLIDRLKNS